MIDDDVRDTMSDRIEEKVRDILIASSDLSDLAVVFRGEPFAVPTKLYPFAVVFCELIREAQGEDGYGEMTGVHYYTYDLYVTIDVLMRDAATMVPTDRRVDVASFLQAKRLTQAALQAVLAWGGPGGEMDDDPVISEDGYEQTVELRSQAIRNGLARRDENVSNKGSVEFRVYTRRLN